MKFLITISKKDFEELKNGLIAVEALGKRPTNEKVIKEVFWLETDPRLDSIDLRDKVKVTEVK
jgi:hypothetical protein